MKYLFILLTNGLLLAATAQKNMEDVVYMQNGSVLRGTITALTEHTLSLQLTGGSVFVFQQQEIDSVKQEDRGPLALARIKKEYYRKEHGYRNITEFGIIYGVNTKKEDNNTYYYYNNVNQDDFGLSVQTINGYQFWPYLYVGAGVGIDRLISYKQTFSPFYLRVASEFLRKRVTPYVFCDVGYSHLWKQKNDDYLSYRNRGGLYVNAGGGIRIYTNSRASVLLSAAYRRNSSTTRWWYTQYDEGVYYTIARTYQRLVVSVGVTF